MTVERFLLVAASLLAILFLLRLMQRRWAHLASLLQQYVDEQLRR
jgi:hypothetical protein